MTFSYFLAAIAAVAVLAQQRAGGSRDHLAMAVVRNGSAAPIEPWSPPQVLAMMTQRNTDPNYDPLTAPRPWWNRLGVGSRPPRPPVVGKKAWVQWWERLRALVLLAAVVLALGALLAAAVGVFVFLLGFLLEQAVS